MFNTTPNRGITVALAKLQGRLNAAKLRLEIVLREKPNDKDKVWVAERRIRDIEEEIRTWQKVR